MLPLTHFPPRLKSHHTVGGEEREGWLIKEAPRAFKEIRRSREEELLLTLQGFSTSPPLNRRKWNHLLLNRDAGTGDGTEA